MTGKPKWTVKVDRHKQWRPCFGSIKQDHAISVNVLTERQTLPSALPFVDLKQYFFNGLERLVRFRFKAIQDAWRVARRIRTDKDKLIDFATRFEAEVANFQFVQTLDCSLPREWLRTRILA